MIGSGFTKRPQKKALNKWVEFTQETLEKRVIAMRAAAGEAKMRGDICDVCEVIFNSGQRSEDGCAAIQFGELFEVNIRNRYWISTDTDIYK